MAIYDWREFEDFDLSGRFPRRDDIIGVDEWNRLIAAIRDLLSQAETAEGAIALSREFDRFLQGVAVLRPRRSRARVFVSHQRNDWEKAERIAWLATEVDFEYWLDIHDPALAFANRARLPRQVRALLIAGIIEMGLLNSTHIVAVQTPQGRKSRWVPYEFGRAKQRVPVSWAAASWFEKGVGLDPNGDYLSLAFCAMTEQELADWLEKQPGAQRVTRNKLWPKPPPPPRALPN